jgi:hypothetical protein
MPENKEVRKLELCDIAPYLPYQLKIKTEYNYVGVLESCWEKDGTLFVNSTANSGADAFVNKKYPNGFKILLRPLDQLTQEITHNGETLVFTELFEIGDDGGYNYEFDFGNIKLIRHLETIAKHNIVSDIAYLPHQVIKEMLKYHFDILGLCDSGLAIPIQNTQ